MPWISPMNPLNAREDLGDCSRLGLFSSIFAPARTKITWDAARRTTTMGKPASWNPMVVPIATAAATAGDMNMAIKIGTWLAKVNEAGSSII